MEQIAEWTKSWKLTVTQAFDRNLTYLKQKETSKQDLKFLYPFLEILPKEEYIDAILREINQLARSSDAYSLPMINLYTSLGKYIYTKYQVHKIYRTYIMNDLKSIKCIMKLI